MEQNKYFFSHISVSMMKSRCWLQKSKLKNEKSPSEMESNVLIGCHLNMSAFELIILSPKPREDIKNKSQCGKVKDKQIVATTDL